MKSLFLFASLLLLASCGKEQFGTASKSESTSVSGLEKYSATFETKKTLLKPKVDILYVVDNSGSTYHIQESLKNSIKKTLETISTEFDYRVISTPLISTSFTNYYIFTNSSDVMPNTSLIVPNTNALIDPIFEVTQNGDERGLKRTIDFMNHHSTTGLLRKNAYHLVVLVSNGRDKDIEYSPYDTDETKYVNNVIFPTRVAEFTQVKNNLESTQLRLFSVTASSGCKEGWRSSQKSYQEMSKILYQNSNATDSGSTDIYDLCGAGLTTLFSGVNASIKQVIVPHKYRYFPVTFANNNIKADINAIQVKKISNGVITNLAKNIDWTYEYYNPAESKPMRENPNSEYVTSQHFIKLTNLLVYPDNILITSTSLVEYFQYVVIPRPAKNDGSIVIRVNNNDIPKTEISYEGYKANTNIKPNGSNTPDVLKSGYFIKIMNPTYFYKSGDSVDVYYTPDSI